ncbi:hypothetical protein LEP1GSC062_0688 [Leptospira alexanderi serovar Manhao 3 str. L 60]|uniref:Uncharacterized protein n=1 Tax=Leptospira alexanderi serovar Manhao 3 str. L 60 TaxID=1049759 RepID=V6I1V8_9LEPT|nr:hypothetical protein LEP1GSC062_0688 [Leptospira alexanderi serovar Manhao 3 str. L 60]
MIKQKWDRGNNDRKEALYLENFLRLLDLILLIALTHICI